MNKLVILSLIVTVFSSTQVLANTNSDNILPVEKPMCNMNLPKKMSMEFISEYPGLHELVNQSSDQFSYLDLTYMCQYIYILKLNPDAQDEDGNTPLHIAAANVNYRAMSALLETGADPTLLNNEGLTPLDVAEAVERYDERYDNMNDFRKIEERIKLITADMSKKTEL